MRRTLKTEAIVLRRDPCGESHRIVTLLSRENGKLQAIAYGGRNSLRRFGGCLDLFCHISAVVVDTGKARLFQLKEATLHENFNVAKASLVAVGQASYLAELTEAMLADEDWGPGIYDLVAESFCALRKGVLSSEALRNFEYLMLSMVGIGPHFACCQICQRTEADQWSFDHDRGGVVCAKCEPGIHKTLLSVSALRFLQRLGKVPIETEKEDRETMNTVRTLLARLIDAHIRAPLKSRAFLRQLAASQKKAPLSLEENTGSPKSGLPSD